MGEPTYAAKLDPAEFAIDWIRPAEEIARLVRLGVAWTTFRGKRLKVLAAELDSRPESSTDRIEWPVPVLRLVSVQPEGKGPMTCADFVRGVRPRADELLL